MAEQLKLKPTDKLLIDGHCDERGTDEYNRALGERRALALREYLVTKGIGGDLSHPHPELGRRPAGGRRAR